MMISAIKKRDFTEASKMISQKEFKSLFEEILLLAFKEEDILYYDFMCFLLENGHNTSEMQYYTSELMATALNILPNGYKLAFEHAKKALALAPNDDSLKEYLLFFYEIPDQLLDKETAISLARDILKKNPDSVAAKQLVKIK